MQKKLDLFLLATFITCLAISAINPHDIFTWGLEVFPAVIGALILVYVYPKFRFTSLVMVFIFIHALILVIGGHYTYAEMPLFNWLQDTFSLERNYYDRLGHFAQGFVPALIARELLIRRNVLENRKWIFFITTSICLALSASYELLEFGVAVLTGTKAEAFLGTQGDVWDTQWDMLLALIGASSSQLFIGRFHDKAIDNMDSLKFK